MKEFIIKVVSRAQHGEAYTQLTEDAMNNPPKGYEVWQITHNPTTQYTTACYRVIYKIKPITTPTTPFGRKFKELNQD